MKIQNIIKNIFLILKNIFLFLFNSIKNKVIIITKGEYPSLNKLLFLWGMFPMFFVLFVLQKNNVSIAKISVFDKIFCLFIALYFSWHFYAIKKTLKIQPKFVVKKIKKKELYKNKTKEEIQNIKSQKRKDLLKKALLLKPWDSSPSYTIIELLDVFVILTQIQRIFF